MLSELRSDSTKHWLKSGAAACLLHAAAIGVLFVNVKFVEAKSPPAAMVIELAVLPAAPPTPQTDIPPGPVQEEAKREKVKPLLKKPPFVPPPEAKTVKPEIALQKHDDPQPDVRMEDKKTVELTTAPPTPDAPPDKKLAAPVVGATSSASATPEMSWENKVLAQLERNKRYPRESRFRREEDVVYVRFVMNRKGEIVSSTIARSQGFLLLENEVLALLKRAAPLPAPPPDVQGDQVELVVPVEFYLNRG